MFSICWDARTLVLFQRIQPEPIICYLDSITAVNPSLPSTSRLKDPVNALENFLSQKEIPDNRNVRDLQIHELKNIGQVLLDEGQTMEAEECCACSQRILNCLESDLDLLVSHKRTTDNVDHRPMDLTDLPKLETERLLHAFAHHYYSSTNPKSSKKLSS